VKKTLSWIDTNGEIRPLSLTPRIFEWPVLSPDGKRLAIRVATPTANQIWHYNLEDRAEDRDGTLLAGEGGNSYPIWSPDGRSIVFGSSKAPDAVNIYRQAIDGVSPQERLTQSPHDHFPNSWAPDGRLLYVEWDGNDYRLFALSLPDKTPKELLHLTVQVGVRSFSVSPDGHWLVYQSGESGQGDIYVRPYPNVTESRIKVSAGGTSPVWHSSRAILFLEGQKLVRAEVETKPAFHVTRITRLYDVPGIGAIAPAPDGRLLRMQPVTQAPPELRVILDWTDEVRSKLAGR
jgi:Tol biopolymer transport system component